MANSAPQASGKDLKVLHKLPRSPVGSYMFRKAAEKGKQAHYILAAFEPWNLAPWIAQYVGNRIGGRHKFLTYDNPSTDSGVYRLSDDSVIGGKPDPNGEIRVSLAADWGTGTDESAEVADRMMEFVPHYTIHLGDVYYVGDDEEVKENCLGVANPGQNFTPGIWPIGSVGSFALNGNHEMYALGDAYFDIFLPKLGLRSSPGANPAGQKASFFCLQNDYWRIIGLDTGYNSISAPLFEYLFPPSAKLRDELLAWIDQQVVPKGDKRSVILLGHHQYYSAFEKHWFTKQAQQLMGRIDRPVLWFWGHEHRMTVYGKASFEGGIEAYGRCIGHGGMPVGLNPKLEHVSCPPVLYDNRSYPNNENIEVGYNGFTNLTFKANQLTIHYRDLTGALLLTENWEVGDRGLTGKTITLGDQFINDPNIVHEADLNRAIR